MTALSHHVHAHDAAGLAAALRHNAVFAQCPQDTLVALAREASIHEDRRGTRIASGDVPFPYLGFVLSGVIAVTASADGEVRTGFKNLRLYEAYAGSTFAEVSVLDGSGVLGEIAVISKHAHYALFPASVVLGMVQDDKTFLRRLASVLAGRSRELKNRLVTQASASVISRVAAALLPFARGNGGLAAVDPQLTEFVQRDVAAAAGCVKEAAARAIAELERNGALRRANGRIRFIDRARLLGYAEAGAQPPSSRECSRHGEIS